MSPGAREPKPLIRLFLAVFPPPGIQHAAFAVTGSLRHAGDGVSWVKEENLHYTLHFLGGLGADGMRRAGQAARAAAAGAGAFEASLGAPGAFPNARRARVLWVGMERGEESLVALSRRLEDALVKRGFERERRFSAHLTIGRVRVPAADWTEPLAAAAAALPGDSRFTVDRLLLMRSKLSPAGSTYTIEVEAPLGAGGKRA